MLNLGKKASRAWKNASGLEKAGMVAGGVAAAYSPLASQIAPLAAQAGLVKGAGSAVSAINKGRKKSLRYQMKQQLRADRERLAQGPQALQLSESEQRQMLQQAQEQANLAAQAQQQAIAQQALAGGEFQQGAFAQAQQAAGAAAQQAAAEATANVQAANQARIDAEADRINAAMREEAKRRQEERRFWSQFGVNLALSALDKATFALDARGGAATGEQTTGTTGTGTTGAGTTGAGTMVDSGQPAAGPAAGFGG